MKSVHKVLSYPDYKQKLDKLTQLCDLVHPLSNARMYTLNIDDHFKCETWLTSCSLLFLWIYSGFLSLLT